MVVPLFYSEQERSRNCFKRYIIINVTVTAPLIIGENQELKRDSLYKNEHKVA
jgi:hypothetical protein